MIETVDFNIVGSYNNQRVSTIDSERSVNLFEYVDPLGKKPKSLINTSGLVNTNADFGSIVGGYRAQATFLGSEYDVIGSSVFLINGAQTVASIGNLTTNTGYVKMDANTFQVIIVDGQNGYIWDTNAETFTQITDTSFPKKPIDVAYLDGFFIVADGDTNNFYLSSFNQGMVWGPDSQLFTADSTVGNNWLILSTTVNYQTGVPFMVSHAAIGLLPVPLSEDTTYYAIHIDSTHIRVATTYENAINGVAITLLDDGTGAQTITSSGQLQVGSITTHPGTIVGCRTLHRRLFLFSQNYTEVWENAGLGTTLPFRRNNALLMEYGTPAVGSISVGFDRMFFLSQDRDGLGSVMMVAGSESIPVSTRALDFQLAQYAAAQQISDCTGFLIKENGLIFYRMNFTGANHTFVYNVTLSNPNEEPTKFWHEEEILDGDRHPAQTHAYFQGINYVGNYHAPIRYIVDSATYTNDGENIRRMRITRPEVPPGYQRTRVDRLQIDVLQGNIAEASPISYPVELLTEESAPLLTEDDFVLLLEQDIIINNPKELFWFLSISKDGGQTYGSKISAPMGNVGQRTYRTLWRKLGTIPRGQAFLAKFEFFDAVPCIILGASWAREILPE